MPRGGRRPGAGRKPNPNKPPKPARVLTGAFLPPSVALPMTLPPVEEFDSPKELADDERAVWMKQAPLAFKNRTLTRSSALAFERYCKVVVLERNEAKSSGVGGANHRGLLKQINTYELQFMLTPNGRPMPDAFLQPETAAPEGKLSRFRS